MNTTCWFKGYRLPCNNKGGLISTPVGFQVQFKVNQCFVVLFRNSFTQQHLTSLRIFLPRTIAQASWLLSTSDFNELVKTANTTDCFQFRNWPNSSHLKNNQHSIIMAAFMAKQMVGSKLGAVKGKILHSHMFTERLQCRGCGRVTVSVVVSHNSVVVVLYALCCYLCLKSLLWGCNAVIVVVVWWCTVTTLVTTTCKT